MNCMPDTGASQSIVSAATARDANLQIRPTLTKLHNASNGVMSLLGEATAVLSNEKHSAQAVVFVSSDLNHSASSDGRIYRNFVSSLRLSQL